MKETKILDLIEEAVNKMAEHGNIPHVIICNKKTFEKISVFFTALGPFEERHVCKKMLFSCEFGELPILKFKYSPDDRIDVLDKETYEKLMKETKGKLSLSSHYDKTVAYKRKGLMVDLGKKTIIRSIR